MADSHCLTSNKCNKKRQNHSGQTDLTQLGVHNNSTDAEYLITETKTRKSSLAANVRFPLWVNCVPLPRQPDVQWQCRRTGWCVSRVSDEKPFPFKGRRRLCAHHCRGRCEQEAAERTGCSLCDAHGAVSWTGRSKKLKPSASNLEQNFWVSGSLKSNHRFLSARHFLFWLHSQEWEQFSLTFTVGLLFKSMF